MKKIDGKKLKLSKFYELIAHLEKKYNTEIVEHYDPLLDISYLDDVNDDSKCYVLIYNVKSIEDDLFN